MRAKDIDQRIVLMECHPVIEVVVDPSAEGSLDVAEIGEHTSIIEVLPFDGDDGSSIMTVKESAFAVVVDEAVPVAESEFLGDPKHRLPPLTARLWEPDSTKRFILPVRFARASNGKEEPPVSANVLFDLFGNL